MPSPGSSSPPASSPSPRLTGLSLWGRFHTSRMLPFGRLGRHQSADFLLGSLPRIEFGLQKGSLDVGGLTAGLARFACWSLRQLSTCFLDAASPCASGHDQSVVGSSQHRLGFLGGRGLDQELVEECHDHR